MGFGLRLMACPYAQWEFFPFALGILEEWNQVMASKRTIPKNPTIQTKAGITRRTARLNGVAFTSSSTAYLIGWI